MNNVKSLKEIVMQLRSCGYTCEAVPLENNVDFQMLERIAGYVPAEHEFGEGERTLEYSFENSVKAMRTIGTALSDLGKLAVRSPQEIRDGIIEQAKRDVAELKTRASETDREPVYKAPNRRGCYAEYIINRTKRTIVVLLRGCFSKKLFAKGIAKCAPDDCFNVHIGKAVALRRALGLEVPVEYLSTPQPTEVRVGDVIMRDSWSTPKPVIENRHVSATKIRLNIASVVVGKLGGKIIDDSRE